MTIFSASRAETFDRRMYYILTTASVLAFFSGWMFFFPLGGCFPEVTLVGFLCSDSAEGFQGESKRCGGCLYFHSGIAEVCDGFWILSNILFLILKLQVQLLNHKCCSNEIDCRSYLVYMILVDHVV